MFSRLTRWLDRLIPFDFRIEHKPGPKMDWRTTYHVIKVEKQRQLVRMITFLLWQRST